MAFLVVSKAFSKRSARRLAVFKMVNRANVVEFTNIVAYHYTLVQNRAYLDDFIDGLRSLDVVQLIQAYTLVCMVKLIKITISRTVIFHG